jgi:hypothetical protein
MLFIYAFVDDFKMFILVIDHTFQVCNIILIVNLSFRLFDNKSQMKMIIPIEGDAISFYICITNEFSLIVMEVNHNIHN